MKRKLFSILFALVLVVSFNLVTAVPVKAADYYVYSACGPAPDGTFANPFCEIQTAIDMARIVFPLIENIYVFSGWYGPVVINTPINVVALDSPAVISGNNVGNAVTITVSDVTLSGFYIEGGYANGGNVWTPYGGIVINGNDGTSALTGITIEDNKIQLNNGNGIFVSAAGHGGGADNIVIRNNEIRYNGVGENSGISLAHLSLPGTNNTCNGPEEEPYDEWRRPQNILVEGNEVYSNDNYGIYVSAGRDIVIRSNEIFANQNGLQEYGLQLTSSFPCAVIPTEYTIVEDNEIYDNACNGVKLTSWNQYNTFTGNLIYSNGFDYGGSTDRYKYGFLFQDGNDNTINDNNISNNALGGLYLWGKGDPSYTWYSTTDNIITFNDFLNGTVAGAQNIYIPAKAGNPNSGVLNSQIDCNNFFDWFGLVSGYGIENADTTQIVNAERNYWNEVDPGSLGDGPSGVGTGSGRAVSTYVDFDPWLLLPSPFGCELCEGDRELDGDVDGMDLAQEINAGGSNIDHFAINFGRTDCPGIY